MTDAIETTTPEELRAHAEHLRARVERLEGENMLLRESAERLRAGVERLEGDCALLRELVAELRKPSTLMYCARCDLLVTPGERDQHRHMSAELERAKAENTRLRQELRPMAQFFHDLDASEAKEEVFDLLMGAGLDAAFVECASRAWSLLATDGPLAASDKPSSRSSGEGA